MGVFFGIPGYPGTQLYTSYFLILIIERGI